MERNLLFEVFVVELVIALADRPNDVVEPRAGLRAEDGIVLQPFHWDLFELPLHILHRNVIGAEAKPPTEGLVVRVSVNLPMEATDQYMHYTHIMIMQNANLPGEKPTPTAVQQSIRPCCSSPAS